MCFSETQSYLNAILLGGTGIYTLPNYKLSLTAIYFSFKELLQGLLYNYQGNQPILKLIATLSWVHIVFQPLILNIFFSHFAPNFKFWNIIFILSIILGIMMTMELNELDIQNDPDCKPKNKNDDFCKKTGGYIGKHHIAYSFHTDKEWKPFHMWIYWQILFVVPVLFTKAWPIGLFSILLVVLIHITYDYIHNIKPDPLPTQTYEFSGEKSAIWCFLTIVFIPIILFEKRIKKYIN